MRDKTPREELDGSSSGTPSSGQPTSARSGSQPKPTNRPNPLQQTMLGGAGLEGFGKGARPAPSPGPGPGKQRPNTVTLQEGSMSPPTSGTTPAAIPPVAASSRVAQEPQGSAAGAVRVRPAPKKSAAANRTLFGAAAPQPPVITSPATSASGPSAGPKYKKNEGPLHRTLIGVPASEMASAARAAAQRSPSARGEVTNAPVLPIGTVEGESFDERRGNRSPQQQAQHRSARERDEPKTMPAVPIEAHETPRNAREAVIRDSMTHGSGPRVQGGFFSGRPSSLPSLPPLRNSLPGRALSKVTNNTLFAVLAAAAVIIVGAEVLRRVPSDASDEDLEAELAAEEMGVMAAAAPTEAQAATPAGPTTKISTNPSGAEIVYRGAVIANTPAAVARPDVEADYLLRKPGYQPQLVRLSGVSPREITLNLTPSGAAANDEGSAAEGTTGLGIDTGTDSDEGALGQPSADDATDETSAGDSPEASADSEASTQSTGPARGRSGLPILPPRHKAPNVVTP